MVKCKYCESNFRTIHLEKGVEHRCYKCGKNNGTECEHCQDEGDIDE